MSNLFLIGFMGTGKSAVGQVLSERANFRCDDLDELIEAQIGSNIADYIDVHGEEAFRDAEMKALNEWIRVHAEDTEDRYQSYCVLACGGGAVLREQNRRSMSENGRVIRLMASPQTIFQRVCGNVGERPMLAGGKPLADRIEELAKEREAYYREAADIEISSEGKTAEQTAELICQALEAPLPQEKP